MANKILAPVHPPSALRSGNAQSTVDIPARGGRALPAPHEPAADGVRLGVLSLNTDLRNTPGGYRGRFRGCIDPLTGKPAIERVPHPGHVPETDWDERNPAPLPDDGRFATLVTQAGHIVSVPLTNGAGLEANPDDGWFRYQQGKHAHLGQFPVTECAELLVKQGLLRADRCHTQLGSGKACTPSAMQKLGGKACPHTMAEIAARRASHNAKMQEIEENLKPTEQKLMERMEGKNDALLNLLAQAITGKKEE